MSELKVSNNYYALDLQKKFSSYVDEMDQEIITTLPNISDETVTNCFLFYSQNNPNFAADSEMLAYSSDLSIRTNVINLKKAIMNASRSKVAAQKEDNISKIVENCCKVVWLAMITLGSLIAVASQGTAFVGIFTCFLLALEANTVLGVLSEDNYSNTDSVKVLRFVLTLFFGPIAQICLPKKKTLQDRAKNDAQKVEELTQELDKSINNLALFVTDEKVQQFLQENEEFQKAKSLIEDLFNRYDDSEEANKDLVRQLLCRIEEMQQNNA